jgi:hypothetical protein
MNCNEESVDRLNVKSIFVFKLILLIRNKHTRRNDINVTLYIVHNVHT